MPKVDIPKFNGDITKWEGFRDAFESLIASTDLKNVLKLHYLKGNLTDETSLVLDNVQVTETNSDTAWQLLIRCYDNPRAIITHIYKNFCRYLVSFLARPVT